MHSRAVSSCSRLGAASFELAKGLSAPRSLVSISVAAILLYVCNRKRDATVRLSDLCETNRAVFVYICDDRFTRTVIA